MLFKKIIILSLILCIISGCESKGIQENLELDAQYNTVFADGWRNGILYNTENGIITYVNVETSKNEKKYFPMYLNDNGVYSMNDSISSVCSYANVDECDNLLPDAVSGIDYYKGKIYYIDLVLNDEVTGYKVNINVSDIDGYNQKVAFHLMDYIPFEEVEGLIYIEFHRDKIYVNFMNELYIGDLNSGKIEKVVIPGVENIWRVFMIDETLYVTSEEYNDGEKVHFDVILECDLDGNLKSMLHENMVAALIDEKLIIYRNRETLTWHIYNRKTKERWQIDDTLYYYVLKGKNTYLLETINMLSDTFRFTILDEEGKIIHTKDYTNDTYYNGGLLYTDDRYYVRKVDFEDELYSFGYYEISDDGISDFKLIPSSEINDK